MKIVINGDFGGFGDEVDLRYEDMVLSHNNDRTNPWLVQFVENKPHLCGDLKVVTIPDSATDWEIHEYDGCESIIYVEDGKIYWAS
jgi:hypothetical protein